MNSNRKFSDARGTLLEIPISEIPKLACNLFLKKNEAKAGDFLLCLRANGEQEVVIFNGANKYGDAEVLLLDAGQFRLFEVSVAIPDAKPLGLFRSPQLLNPEFWNIERFKRKGIASMIFTRLKKRRTKVAVVVDTDLDNVGTANIDEEKPSHSEVFLFVE
jgi:hypothetical protein